MAARASEKKPRSKRRAAALEAEAELGSARERAQLPIVAIGASAGGLEAFEKFFDHMPPDSGMGFVLVPHLDARHKSAMTEILQRHTAMAVVEISNGMPILADRVHIIPPNATLTIEHARFRVATPRGRGLTIDAFFRSLAEDQSENAIGVILSGSGSDGALGIRAIKESGGLTFAQATQSSRYESMPHSAVATGLVDIVLPVEEMPAKLMEYARQRSRRAAPIPEKPSEEARRHFGKIYALLRAKTGHDFSHYKHSTIARRVQRRMQVLQCASLAEYVEALLKDPTEVAGLFRDILIGVTHFFRDRRFFEALDAQVMPKLVADKTADDRIRVWVPGCATGEEAYSIAMLLREQFADPGLAPRVQIFATDIDEASIEMARAGRYPEVIARDIPAARLQRFFARDGTAYRVVKEIREMCIFSVQNLIKDAPFSKLDLISCRNLLIYLDGSLQNRVIPLFHFALRPGGYLFLGPSENIGAHGKLFDTVARRARIFRARPVHGEGAGAPMGPDAPAAYRPEQAASLSPSAIEETLSRRAMRLMESYSPAYVVVDDRHEVVHFSGRTGKYLQPSPGAANLSLFNILDTNLRPEVRTALQSAALSGRKAMRENIRFAAEGGENVVNIIVEPIPPRDGAPRLYVVGLQDMGFAKARSAGEPKADGELRNDDVLTQLEAELAATRERLQATIEELETSNEEMKASNEEFQSVNEELQSSNEELETSKEEIQAVNEELETVNSELNSKLESLERATNDRKNLLESTQIATIFLDNTLRIKSFTPAIADIFNLIDSDRGRLISDIAMRVAHDGFKADVQKVLRTLSPIEQEVTLADRRASYTMRILPYRTTDNVIDGVVITFLDITERKHREETSARLAAIVESSHDAIIGMAPDGRITSWNAGAERTYGHTAEEAVGSSLSLIIPAGRARELRKMVERVKRSRASAVSETVRVTKDKRRIPVSSTVSSVRGARGQVIAFSVIERDISERKKGEEHLKMLLAELNHRVKNTLATVLSISSRTSRHSPSIQAFREAFDGRIRALASAHASVAASHWESASLKEVAGAILAPYREAGHRISTTGADIRLKPNAGLILSMAFHELATNAVKYGALSTEKGRVELRWKKDAGDRVSIRWTERNGPKISKPRSNGFGLRLIERIATHELGGGARLDFAPSGIVCTLGFPLEE